MILCRFVCTYTWTYGPSNIFIYTYIYIYMYGRSLFEGCGLMVRAFYVFSGRKLRVRVPEGCVPSNCQNAPDLPLFASLFFGFPSVSLASAVSPGNYGSWTSYLGYCRTL